MFSDKIKSYKLNWAKLVVSQHNKEITISVRRQIKDLINHQGSAYLLQDLDLNK